MSRDRLGRLYSKLTPVERRDLLVRAVWRGDSEEAIRLDASGIHHEAGLPEYSRPELFSDLRKWVSLIPQPSPKELAALRDLANTSEDEMDILRKEECARIARQLPVSWVDKLEFPDDAPDWLKLPALAEYVNLSRLKEPIHRGDWVPDFLYCLPRFKRVLGVHDFATIIDGAWGQNIRSNSDELAVDGDKASEWKPRLSLPERVERILKQRAERRASDAAASIPVGRDIAKWLLAYSAVNFS